MLKTEKVRALECFTLFRKLWIIRDKRNISNTYDFIINFNAILRSLATNQSIKKADIRGAFLYNLKKAWKLPSHHAERTFSACCIHSSTLSSNVSAAKIVVKSEMQKDIIY